MSFNLTPDVMRSLALSMLGKTQEQQARMKLSNRESFFKQHLGSSTNVLCVMWSDLHLFSLLSKKESSYKGLKMFMIAHYFLYSYPRNSTQISSMFQICERYTRGKPLWDWVRKIQSLKAHKVKWLPHFGEPNSETFIITVDGTDCKIWELVHSTLRVDPGYKSDKFNKAGLKYEIAVAVFHNKIVWVNGPFPAGKSKIRIFCEDGLKQQMPPGKMLIADKGLRTSEADEVDVIAFPSSTDSDELMLFKSRARCRHEIVNGLIKDFKVLSQTF